MSNAIEYLNHPSAKLALDVSGSVYKKAEITQLMLPKEDQIGDEVITFVKDGDGVRQESSNVIEQHHIMARNPNPIGQDGTGNPIYNVWLVPSETVRKNYGDEAIRQLLDTDGFSDHQKKATIKAVKLTPELAEAITGEPGAIDLKIKVSWSKDPMVANVGDYITDQGYSISAHDMQAYNLIEPVKEDKAPSKPAYANDSPSLG